VDEWERYEWLGEEQLIWKQLFGIFEDKTGRMEAVTNQHPPSSRATRLRASGSAMLLIDYL